LHFIKISHKFTASFFDKYLKLILMSKVKQLSEQEIKALKAKKEAIINSNKTVKK